MTRLAYGVVAGRGLGVFAPGPDGAAPVRTGLPAGTPVVVGPRRAQPSDVAAALAGLTELVRAGGDVVAGADVDLGGGFRTARLAGGAGDRRDAVLAALRVLGRDGAARLGDRAAVLVALFGPAATRRVGAAATSALHDGRWAALHLASAASDLLGPEQLERVLALDDPHEVPPLGLASALAADLARVLERYPRPRRLALLLDLWSVVAAQHADADRRRKLRALRGPDDRVDEVRKRYQRLVDDEILATVAPGMPAVRVAEVVRWAPQSWHWRSWVQVTMVDAVAATALIRAAIAVADRGLEDGLAQVRPVLAVASTLMARRRRAEAAQPVPDLARVPARPGVHVWRLHQLLSKPDGLSGRVAAMAQSCLALAHDYGVVVLEEARELIAGCAAHEVDLAEQWHTNVLQTWREAAGYTRSPYDWGQAVLRGPSTEDERAAPLAQRLRARPESPPHEVEHPGDLLWYAELGDAVAQLEGYDAAHVQYGERYPEVEPVPPGPDVQPLRPVDDSVPAAVAGAAQLVELGAEPPTKPRTWTELIDGLMASTVVLEALAGAFAVPRVVLDRDGSTLPPAAAQAAPPGHDGVVVEIARDTHQVVAWAQYMGNCISGPYYLGEALRGRSVLAALRTREGALLANVELRPHRTGWRVEEFKMRFNQWPPDELDERLQAWVASLPPAPRARGPASVPRRAHTAARRPYRPNQELADLRRALAPLAARALDEPDVRQAIDIMARVGDARGAGIVGLSALRRVGRADLDEAVRRGLTGGVDLADLWRATAVRPLATAIAGLDRRSRHPLDALLGDEPLPALARRLGRTVPIAQARTVEVVARRLRRSLGRLACSDDPVLAALVPRRADPSLLCAIVLTVSSAATAASLTPVTRQGQLAVPGHPLSTLDDESGPWYRAREDAITLGADLSGRVPPALMVPASWLGRGGWPALWARVNRR